MWIISRSNFQKSYDRASRLEEISIWKSYPTDVARKIQVAFKEQTELNRKVFFDLWLPLKPIVTKRFSRAWGNTMFAWGNPCAVGGRWGPKRGIGGGKRRKDQPFREKIRNTANHHHILVLRKLKEEFGLET